LSTTARRNGQLLLRVYKKNMYVSVLLKISTADNQQRVLNRPQQELTFVFARLAWASRGFIVSRGFRRTVAWVWATNICDGVLLRYPEVSGVGFRTMSVSSEYALAVVVVAVVVVAVRRFGTEPDWSIARQRRGCRQQEATGVSYRVLCTSRVRPMAAKGAGERQTRRGRGRDVVERDQQCNSGD